MAAQAWAPGGSQGDEEIMPPVYDKQVRCVARGSRLSHQSGKSALRL